jgi:hypothetical protein
VERRARGVGIDKGDPSAELRQVDGQIHGDDAGADASSPTRDGDHVTHAAGRRWTSRFGSRLLVLRVRHPLAIYLTIGRSY